jgi:hypothetical protein
MSRKEHLRKTLAKQKTFRREWLQKPGTVEMKVNAARDIEKDMQNDSPASLLNLSDSVVRLATWYGTSGQVRLLDGDTSGWREIHRSWLYLSLALRIRITVFQTGRVLGEFRPVKSLETEASASALCLAYGLVVQRDFESSFFADALRVMLMEKDIVREAYWEYHYLEAFSVQLFALLRRENINVAKDFERSLGVYQGVLDAWNQPSLLARAVSDVCDFHCGRIDDKSNKFSAEFRSSPFDLVPAEILAIYAVRQALGLDTPRVEHPLLEPPFNTPAGTPDEVQDALLDEIETKL